jgi:bifunctional DNA-binding transcriptional regulator/antitoxin component of YhaV-PrlF toxin-antitoxin module
MRELVSVPSREEPTMTAKTIEMGGNGRLVVPTEARKALGLSGPAKFDVSVENGTIVLVPVMTVPLDRTFPITPELVAAADRARNETGPGRSRAAVREALGHPAASATKGGRSHRKA